MMILAAEPALRPPVHRRFILLLPLCLALLTAACDGPGSPAWHFGGPVMGTSYQVTVAAPPPGLARAAVAAAVAQSLAQTQRLFSTYEPDSELSRFNRAAAGIWFSVSTSTAEVAALSLEVSRLTQGRFDPTVGPLVDLWGFGPSTRSAAVPRDEAIAAAHSRVGYEHLQVRQSPPALRKSRAGLQLDFSAVAKGYGVDRAAQCLAMQGVENYLVEVGGEMRSAGRSPRGGAWRIGIEHPDGTGRAAIRTISLHASAALATSGDYQNFFEAGGRRYAHIIDPATGQPMASALSSVTVAGQRAARADALATALMLMTPQEGIAFAEAHGVAALLLLRTEEGFDVHSSSAFTPYLE